MIIIDFYFQIKAQLLVKMKCYISNIQAGLLPDKFKFSVDF